MSGTSRTIPDDFHLQRLRFTSTVFLLLVPFDLLTQDTYDAVGETIDRIQDVRASLLDTRGPEIRSGKLAHDDSGHETITLTKGDNITLQTNETFMDSSTAENLYIDYDKLHKCLYPGMKVLLDDGAIILTVNRVNPADSSVVCNIDNSGELVRV